MEEKNIPPIRTLIESYISGSQPQTTSAITSGENDIQKPEVSQVRPWVRYWARTFDLFLFSFIVSFALAIIAPTILEASEAFLTFLIMQCWVFQESILLSTWGTTPGKWLFGIKLRDKSGKKLNLSCALGRSFSVWLKGYGLGIPFISFITLLTARSRLKKVGITVWDEQGGFVVTHYKIGALRPITTVLLFVGILLLVGAENAIEERPSTNYVAEEFQQEPNSDSGQLEDIPSGYMYDPIKGLYSWIDPTTQKVQTSSAPPTLSGTPIPEGSLVVAGYPISKQKFLQEIDKAWEQEFQMIKQWLSVEENQARSFPDPLGKQIYQQAENNFDRRHQELKAKYYQINQEAKNLPDRVDASYLTEFWRLHQQQMQAKGTLWEQNRKRELEQIWASYEKQQRHQQLIQQHQQIIQQINQLKAQIESGQRDLEWQLRGLELELSRVKSRLEETQGY